MKKIQSKKKLLERQQDFSHYKSMGIFARRSRAGNLAVRDRTWPNFELIRDFMVVLATCKNEEDSFKMKALEWPQDYMSIFQTLKGR